jgi:hypothetical protein
LIGGVLAVAAPLPLPFVVPVQRVAERNLPSSRGNRVV